MSVPAHRIIAVAAGLMVAPFVANELEQRRATTPPPGWSSESDPGIPPLTNAWRVLDSAWRVAEGTTWVSKRPAEQLYVRTELTPRATLELSLQATNDDGMRVRFQAGLPAVAERSGDPISCMGSVTPPATTAAIELQRTPDGVLIRWGDSTMICRDPAPPETGTPRLRVTGAAADIQSVGRDRARDGVPLAPIWWMAVVVMWMLPWIVVFDAIRGLLPVKPTETLSSEE
ncbi:MAG: hypothetical protein VX944_09270 [Myxococcota bacterium]|nr:hypothetical protein [Myxococcota bacterium]MEC9390252.1 hypothetical protein [Myxococcota bacterium]